MFDPIILSDWAELASFHEKSGLKRFDTTLPLVVMAVPDHARYQDMADSYGIKLWFEAFVDRAYGDDGRLMPRTEAGSSHTTIEAIQTQAFQMIEQGSVTTPSGNMTPINADTLCIHGDGPLAPPMAKLLHDKVARL